MFGPNRTVSTYGAHVASLLAAVMAVLPFRSSLKGFRLRAVRSTCSISLTNELLASLSMMCSGSLR